MKSTKGAKDGFVSAVGWMGASKIVTQFGTWVATIVIARLLVPADYGLESFERQAYFPEL